MEPTRSQKIHLAIFLIVAGTILFVTLFLMIGRRVIEKRDDYVIILHGGSGGLEIGAQVRYNGIVVGRVEQVKLQKDNPGDVRIDFSVLGDTPLAKDTIGVPELTGLTGSKRLALSGGRTTKELLEPGSVVPAAEDDFSSLTVKVASIAEKIEGLMENLVQITNLTNRKGLAQAIEEMQAIMAQVNAMMKENAPAIGQTINNVQVATAKLETTLQKFDGVLDGLQNASDKIASEKNLREIDRTLKNINLLTENINKRVGDNELGTTISSVNALSSDAHLTVLRMRDDLRRIFVELEKTVENLNEFSQMLVENPTILISGRNEKDRKLP